MDDEGFMKIGPAGKECRKPWDEKGCTEIVQIFISHDEEKICSIQFQYMKNGTLVLSNQYGQLSRTKFDVIKFNYPDEYVTNISGTYGPSSGYSSNDQSLSSLSIGTNLSNYVCSCRGYSSHNSFKYNLGKDHQFGGFFGFFGDQWLTSIGIYFKPLRTLDTVEINAKRVKKEHRT